MNKKREPIGYRDRDGDVWSVAEPGRLEMDGRNWRTEVAEEQYGPLTPIYGPTWLTATWQRRLVVVAVVINLALFVVTTVFVIVRSEPSLYLNVTVPALVITVGFPLLLFAVIRTLVWVWPQLDD